MVQLGSVSVHGTERDKSSKKPTWLIKLQSHQPHKANAKLRVCLNNGAAQVTSARWCCVAVAFFVASSIFMLDIWIVESLNLYCS